MKPARRRSWEDTVNGSLRRPEEERLVRRHSGARAVANCERHGTHASRDVATREDATHGGLLRLVGPEEGAERALVERAAERLGERESGPRAGLQEEPVKPQLASVLEANVDRRHVAGDLDNAHVLDVNAAAAWPRLRSSLG